LKITTTTALRALATFSLPALGVLYEGSATAADDAPTIAKDWVQFTPYTVSVYHKDFKPWAWVPHMTFRVNGPMPSGSQLFVEVSVPGAGGPWVKFDCPTSETQKGRWHKTECGGHDLPDDKGTLATGTVHFAIKMRNELTGAPELTLFGGEAKVGKVHSNDHGPAFANEFVYFADHDWNLPIGYLFLTPAEVQKWDLPELHVAFWLRGDPGNLEPHLFYKGAEVGKKFFGHDEVGRAICDAEIENGTTHFVEDTVPQKAKWTRMQCGFPNVRAWDKTGQAPGPMGAPFTLLGNPGDYEFKLLWNNHLARSIKFTVNAEGKFGNGLAEANKLGSERTIVPVQILGDQDGTWDHNAWRSAAFYGNPLTGFTAAP
jgi:hypothetical protein